jgi:hypothetical protein
MARALEAATGCAARDCARRGYKTPADRLECVIRYLRTFVGRCTAENVDCFWSCGLKNDPFPDFKCDNSCKDLCCKGDEVKCCHFTCTDGLPFYLEIPTANNCPLAYMDEMKDCRYAQIITTGHCPPNPMRPGPS